MKSYKPMSNLSLFSKRIKKVATRCRAQLITSIIIKVHNDITEPFHKGSMAGLILLDLTVAFDLTGRGIKVKALSWREW